MDSRIVEGSGVGSKNGTYNDNKEGPTLLKIAPWDALYVNLLPKENTAEAHFTLSNQSNRSVYYKVLVKSAESAKARILGASPTGGVLRPTQTQMVRVVISSQGLEGDHSPTDFQDSVICKLMVMASYGTDNVNKEVDAFCKGDKTEVWDFSENSIFSRRSEEHELTVHVLLPPNKSSTLISSPVMSSPLHKSTPNYRLDGKSSSVVESIQELISDNELLRKHMENLEHRHQDNVHALTEARKEIEESKMKSVITCRLMKELEDSKSRKAYLEKEICFLKQQEMERKDKQLESNVLLQGLRLETERLSQENRLLRQHDEQNYESIEKLKQRLEETKTKYECLKEKLRLPLSNRGGYMAAPDISQLQSLNRILNNSALDGRSKEAMRSWQDDSHLDSFLLNRHLNTSDTPTKQIPTSSVQASQTGRDKSSFYCDDENLLFFLKSMTLFFAGLTFLAACNILVTDLVR